MTTLRLCGGCGRLREDLCVLRECRECREAAGTLAAFADFLLRFDRQTPKIPTPVNPEYREWVTWAKDRTAKR